MAHIAEETSRLTNGVVILVVLTVIVLLSVLFEIAKEWMLHSSSKNTRPVLLALFGEMTILGFIGLVLFVIVKADVLQWISEKVLSGDAEDLQETVELVHMMLFGVMCAYLTMCFWLTRLSQSLMSKWETFERASKTSEDLHKCLSAYSSSPKKACAAATMKAKKRLRTFRFAQTLSTARRKISTIEFPHTSERK